MVPFRFATMNPGAVGLRGQAHVVESSSLASRRTEDPSFLDIEAYAKYGRGLIIYNGIDFEHVGSPAYEQLVTRELAQPFDPDHLPCSQPLADFIITADSALESPFMAAGKTYAYPFSVEANFGYSGKVTLDATVLPADPAISLKLDSPVADITKVESASASLTVTAGPAASLKSNVVAVRGRDAAGKSNVVCLNLPERTSSSLMVVSGLTPDKTPTKNPEFILDASGSMKALLGKKTRWATAQEVLKEGVAKLTSDFSAGRLAPRGETPLVYSILQTPGNPTPVGGRTVILITDGEESCKGDFAAAAKTLKDSGLNLTQNIVSFTLTFAIKSHRLVMET